jgi:hypothetical protein
LCLASRPAAAWEHLLVDTEVATLAARLKERVTPAQLRQLSRAGHDDDGGTWQAAGSCPRRTQ